MECLANHNRCIPNTMRQSELKANTSNGQKVWENMHAKASHNKFIGLVLVGQESGANFAN